MTFSGLTGGPATDLCAPFIARLPITGVCISVFDTAGHQVSVSSSDETAARIDELQFELGEGPQWEAVRTGKRVLLPDVARNSHAGWPVFGAALPALGIGALFAFPMILSRQCVGAVGLYRRTAGVLGSRDLSTAGTMAAAVAGAAVSRAVASLAQDGPTDTDASPALQREVHQATGMILAQLQTTPEAAYSRMQAHAFSTGRSVHDVARDVVSRRLNFRHLGE